jgi:hypothetical protein
MKIQGIKAIDALGLNNATKIVERKLSIIDLDNNTDNEILVKAVYGPSEIFRHNTYTWYAILLYNSNKQSFFNNVNNSNLFNNKNQNKIQWGYTIDDSKKIIPIKSFYVSNVPNNIMGPSLTWKVPNIKCDSIKVYAWFKKTNYNVKAISKYLPLKEIYVKLLNNKVSESSKINLKKVGGSIQSIVGNDKDQSKVFNMDYFSVRIDKLPTFKNDKEENIDVLYKKIRAAFLKLSKGTVSFVSYGNKFKSTVNVDGAWEFKPYEIEENDDFGKQQLKLWNEEKGGTIFFIDAGGGFIESNLIGDDGAVLESESNTKERCWIFTTIVTKKSETQPFSGHRQFGIHEDEDGNYRFYARAIDRIWPSSTILIVNEFEPTVDDYLTIANATWNNLIKNVSKFINDFGGKTTIMKPEIIVSEFKPFLDNYKSNTLVQKVGNIKQFKNYEK